MHSCQFVLNYPTSTSRAARLKAADGVSLYLGIILKALIIGMSLRRLVYEVDIRMYLFPTMNKQPSSV